MKYTDRELRYLRHLGLCVKRLSSGPLPEEIRSSTARKKPAAVSELVEHWGHTLDTCSTWSKTEADDIAWAVRCEYPWVLAARLRGKFTLPVSIATEICRTVASWWFVTENRREVLNLLWQLSSRLKIVSPPKMTSVSLQIKEIRSHTVQFRRCIICTAKRPFHREATTWTKRDPYAN